MHIGDLLIIRTECLVSLIDFNIKPLIITLSPSTSTSLLDTAMKISDNNPAIIEIPYQTQLHPQISCQLQVAIKSAVQEPDPQMLPWLLFAELRGPYFTEKRDFCPGRTSSGVRNYTTFSNSYDNVCAAPCTFLSLAFLGHQSYNVTITTYLTCQSILMKYTFSVLMCVYFLCLSVLCPRKHTKISNEEIQNSSGWFTSYLSVPEGYHLCIVLHLTMLVTFLFYFNTFEKYQTLNDRTTQSFLWRSPSYVIERLYSTNKLQQLEHYKNLTYQEQHILCCTNVF